MQVTKVHDLITKDLKQVNVVNELKFAKLLDTKMAKTRSKASDVEDMNSDFIEIKSTASGIPDKLVGLESTVNFKKFKAKI